MEEKSNYSVSISKDQLSMLPVEKYEGKIIIVSSEETAQKAVSDLRKEGIVGFDTETKPSFRKGTINKVALIQLATAEKSYLIRLSKIGFLPESIKEFFEDENIIKIGLSIKDDFLNLSRMRKMEPKGFIDIQNYAKDFKIKDNSLTKIYSIIFGKRISKSQQLSNWEAPSLSDGQKNYASLDAAACLKIYKELSGGKFVPERSPYFGPEAQCNIKNEKTE